MWNVYKHSSVVKLPSFWRDAFGAAYQDLSSEVATVHNAALREIAKMSFGSTDISDPTPRYNIVKDCLLQSCNYGNMHFCLSIVAYSWFELCLLFVKSWIVWLDQILFIHYSKLVLLWYGDRESKEEGRVRMKMGKKTRKQKWVHHQILQPQLCEIFEFPHHILRHINYISTQPWHPHCKVMRCIS